MTITTTITNHHHHHQPIPVENGATLVPKSFVSGDVFVARLNMTKVSTHSSPPPPHPKSSINSYDAP